MLSQFDFQEVDNGKPREIVCPEPDSQDYIPCTNESKIIAETINTNIKANKDARNSTKNIINNAQDLTKEPSKTYSNKVLNSVPKCIPVTVNSTKTNNPILANKPIDHIQTDLHSVDNFVSPKHLKRKIINSHFDQQSKRKFPGPAGLLTGVLEEAKDESIGEIEFLSQVSLFILYYSGFRKFECTQNYKWLELLAVSPARSTQCSERIISSPHRGPLCALVTFQTF